MVVAGQVVEEGDYEQLLRRDGIFHGLAAKQERSDREAEALALDGQNA